MFDFFIDARRWLWPEKATPAPERLKPPFVYEISLGMPLSMEVVFLGSFGSEAKPGIEIMDIFVDAN